jgi:hypothetical protein
MTLRALKLKMRCAGAVCAKLKAMPKLIAVYLYQHIFAVLPGQSGLRDIVYPFVVS